MAKEPAPSHLLDESPLTVYKSLAAAMGINKAHVFQQLHFLLNGQKTAKNDYVLVDGRWWVYNTYPEWREHFPWLSVSAIKGFFRGLEKDGLVISRQGVKSNRDRRKWYTIDYAVWDSFKLTIGQKVSAPLDKKYPMDGTKNVSWDGQKMSDDSSMITTKTPTTSNTKTLAPDGAVGFSDPPENVLAEGKDITPNPDEDANVSPTEAQPPTPAVSLEGSVTNSVTLPDQPPKSSAPTPLPNGNGTTPAALMNPMKNAIAAAFDWDWKTMSKDEAGLVSKAAKQLCEVDFDPLDIPSLYRYCTMKFTSFKPMALPGNQSDWRKTQVAKVAEYDGEMRMVDLNQTLFKHLGGAR